MVKRALAVACALAGCSSFEDPDIVLDLRVLAVQATPPDQLVDIDTTSTPNPATLFAQLTPTEVCALVADPGQARQLAWSMVACPFGDNASGERCEGDHVVPLGSGVIADPDTTVPRPAMCVTVEPNAALLDLLIAVVMDDDLRGLGGIDYNVQLRVGGLDADRALDQYAAKTVRVVPRIPMDRTANANPTMMRLDATFPDGTVLPAPLTRCAEAPSTLPPLEPEQKLRLTPIEPAGAREVYVAPTLDGKSQTFTESLTYQWIADDGGFSSGDTGGPRDISGNPAPLFTDFKAPAAEDLDGPTDVTVWIIQRDERLGLQWYESCVRVSP